MNLAGAAVALKLVEHIDDLEQEVKALTEEVNDLRVKVKDSPQPTMSDS